MLYLGMMITLTVVSFLNRLIGAFKKEEHPFVFAFGVLIRLFIDLFLIYKIYQLID
jgi:hypothetical protein